jgi:hypothetical protein
VKSDQESSGMLEEQGHDVQAQGVEATDAVGLAVIDLEAHWEVSVRLSDERVEQRPAAGDPGRFEIARTWPPGRLTATPVLDRPRSPDTDLAVPSLIAAKSLVARLAVG